jgi:hypothetical protein
MNVAEPNLITIKALKAVNNMWVRWDNRLINEGQPDLLTQVNERLTRNKQANAKKKERWMRVIRESFNSLDKWLYARPPEPAETPGGREEQKVMGDAVRELLTEKISDLYEFLEQQKRQAPKKA